MTEPSSSLVAIPLPDAALERAVRQPATAWTAKTTELVFERAAALTSAGLGPNATEAGSAQLWHTLYALYESQDSATAVHREFVAGVLTARDPSWADAPHDPRLLDDAVFRQALLDLVANNTMGPLQQAQVASQSTLSRAQFALLARHNWYRSRSFYRLGWWLLGRIELRSMKSLAENLFGEVGSHGPTHPDLLARLLSALGMESRFDDHPTWTEAHRYIVYRQQTIRQPGVDWGLGMLFALESSPRTGHEQMVKLVKAAGFTDDIAEFFTVHLVVDLEHVEEMLDLIRTCVQDVQGRSNVVHSARRFCEMRRLYSDRLWREVHLLK
ncbi:MAG: iron-containing redox enzyme family protein [Archangium sp.]|nr:iron-containing redox enzyme family protein [Archangium sp.]